MCLCTILCTWIFFYCFALNVFFESGLIRAVNSSNIFAVHMDKILFGRSKLLTCRHETHPYGMHVGRHMLCYNLVYYFLEIVYHCNQHIKQKQITK